MKRFVFVGILFSGLVASAQPSAGDSVQVDLSIQLGDEAPFLNRSFDTSQGVVQRPGELFGTAATAVIFWVDACPWTIVSRDRLEEIVARFGDEGVGFLFVELRRRGDTGATSTGPEIDGVPFLLDPAGDQTRVYGATVAPEVFVFDGERKLVYAGALDDSPADDETVRDSFLVEILDALTSGQKVEPRREPALGCIGSQDRQLGNG